MQGEIQKGRKALKKLIHTGVNILFFLVRFNIENVRAIARVALERDPHHNPSFQQNTEPKSIHIIGSIWGCHTTQQPEKNSK